MWECQHCRKPNEDNFDVCWNCGTSIDGVRDANFERVQGSTTSDESIEEPKSHSLSCPHCRWRLTFVGNKKFVLSDLGGVLNHHESFDVYLCRRCGRLEFFLEGVGEEFRHH
jgi:DNA-directed RNA polymerase subunit RPC12/RpoP